MRWSSSNSLSMRLSSVCFALGNGTHFCEMTLATAGIRRTNDGFSGSTRATPSWPKSLLVTSDDSQLPKKLGPPIGSPGTPGANSTKREFVNSLLQPKRSSPRLLPGCTWKVAAALPTLRRVTTIEPNVPLGVAGEPTDTGPFGSSTIVAVTSFEVLRTNPRVGGNSGKKPPPANAPLSRIRGSITAVNATSAVRWRIRRSPFITGVSMTFGPVGSKVGRASVVVSGSTIRERDLLCHGEELRLAGGVAELTSFGDGEALHGSRHGEHHEHHPRGARREIAEGQRQPWRERRVVADHAGALERLEAEALDGDALCGGRAGIGELDLVQGQPADPESFANDGAGDRRLAASTTGHGHGGGRGPDVPGDVLEAERDPRGARGEQRGVVGIRAVDLRSETCRLGIEVVRRRSTREERGEGWRGRAARAARFGGGHGDARRERDDGRRLVDADGERLLRLLVTGVVLGVEEGGGDAFGGDRDAPAGTRDRLAARLSAEQVHRDVLHSGAAGVVGGAERERHVAVVPAGGVGCDGRRDRRRPSRGVSGRVHELQAVRDDVELLTPAGVAGADAEQRCVAELDVAIVDDITRRVREEREPRVDRVAPSAREVEVRGDVVEDELQREVGSENLDRHDLDRRHDGAVAVVAGPPRHERVLGVGRGVAEGADTLEDEGEVAPEVGGREGGDG